MTYVPNKWITYVLTDYLSCPKHVHSNTNLEDIEVNWHLGRFPVTPSNNLNRFDLSREDSGFEHAC